MSDREPHLAVARAATAHAVAYPVDVEAEAGDPQLVDPGAGLDGHELAGLGEFERGQVAAGEPEAGVVGLRERAIPQLAVRLRDPDAELGIGRAGAGAAVGAELELEGQRRPTSGHGRGACDGRKAEERERGDTRARTGEMHGTPTGAGQPASRWSRRPARIMVGCRGDDRNTANGPDFADPMRTPPQHKDDGAAACRWSSRHRSAAGGHRLAVNLALDLDQRALFRSATERW